MKKFTKGMLITAGVFGVLGIGLSAGGVAMGATVDSVKILRDFRDRVNTELTETDYYDDDMDDRYDDYDDRYDDDDYDDDYDNDYEERHDRAATKSTDAVQGTTEDGVRSYTLNDVTKLDVELTWDSFVMESWDKNSFGVEIEGDEREEVSVLQQGQEVKIVSKKLEEKHEEPRTVTFYYPEKTNFREVDIEIGAGTAELMDAIIADEFSFTVGTGEGNSYDRINAGEISLEVGVGLLDLDVIEAWEIDGECGMGSLDATFAGREEDYFIKTEGGLNSIVIGSDELGGITGNHSFGNKGAAHTAEFECGMGSINIDFEEE